MCFVSVLAVGYLSCRRNIISKENYINHNAALERLSEMLRKTVLQTQLGLRHKLADEGKKVFAFQTTY